MGELLDIRKCTKDHGLVIDWETVRRVIEGLDQAGVEMRTKRWFRRRRFVAPSPNFKWHLDGYDKLKPYGFCIRDAKDGYSWSILRLDFGPTKNDPMITIQYYIDCVQQLNGLPRVVRGYCGTENIHIWKEIMETIMCLGKRASCMENLWQTKELKLVEFLRKSNTDWRMHFFNRLGTFW